MFLSSEKFGKNSGTVYSEDSVAFYSAECLSVSADESCRVTLPCNISGYDEGLLAGKIPVGNSKQPGFGVEISFIYYFIKLSVFRVCHFLIFARLSVSDHYFPNPQLGNVQISQFRHSPPSPSLSKSSFSSISPVMILGRTISNIVLFAYITHPGSPMTGMLFSP